MPLAMSQAWLVLGPPGCGKTSWIRDQLVRHPSPYAYWRLQGPSFDNLEQGLDGGIDGAWLNDQIPELQIPAGQPSDLLMDDRLLRDQELLMVVEVQHLKVLSAPVLKTFIHRFRSNWRIFTSSRVGS